jgi:separase
MSSIASTQAPATMLWGCSSGKLTLKGKHDPLGPILTHLLHGAYFVVGNLWDVTDGDIDKLSMECMKNSLPVPPQSTSSTATTTTITTVKGAKKSKASSVTMVVEDEKGNNQIAERSSQGEGLPMSQSIVQARTICKLKYAVGCAPVIYGFPVSIIE